MVTTLTPGASAAANTTLIVNAINAAIAAGGGDIVLDGSFPANKIWINNATYGTQMNVTLRGATSDTPLTPSQQEPFFIINRGKGFHIRNLVMNCPTYTYAAHPNLNGIVNVIRLLGCQNFEVEDVVGTKGYDTMYIGCGSDTSGGLDLPVEELDEPSINFVCKDTNISLAQNTGVYFGYYSEGHLFNFNSRFNESLGIECNGGDIFYELGDLSGNANFGWATQSSSGRHYLRNVVANGSTGGGGFGVYSSGIVNVTRNVIFENCIAKRNFKSGIQIERVDAWPNPLDDILVINPELRGNSQDPVTNWGNFQIGSVGVAQMVNRIAVVGGIMDGAGPKQVRENIAAYYADKLRLYKVKQIGASGANIIDASVTNYQEFT